jgi:hypothetical protein
MDEQKVGKRMDPKNGINGNGMIRFGKTENGWMKPEG